MGTWRAAQSAAAAACTAARMPSGSAPVSPAGPCSLFCAHCSVQHLSQLNCFHCDAPRMTDVCVLPCWRLFARLLLKLTFLLHLPTACVTQQGELWRLTIP
jgi:hypothetical protein